VQSTARTGQKYPEYDLFTMEGASRANLRAESPYTDPEISDANVSDRAPEFPCLDLSDLNVRAASDLSQIFRALDGRDFY
jgi:hypothetical protein